MGAINLLPEFKEYLKKETDRVSKMYEGQKKSLTIISFAGESGGSNTYVNGIKKLAAKFNVTVNERIISCSNTSLDIVGEIIKELNKSDCDGIILVKPYLANRHYIEFLYNSISGEKDIDGAGINSIHYSSTSLAVSNYLVDNFDISGKNIAVIGRSRLVGLPIAGLLTFNDATVTLAHTKSDIEFVCGNADIIVSCTGYPGLINKKTLSRNNKDLIVVDVGYNVVNGEVLGDIDIDSISDMDNVRYLPAKGGIGNLTRLILFVNLL